MLRHCRAPLTSFCHCLAPAVALMCTSHIVLLICFTFILVLTLPVTSKFVSLLTRTCSGTAVHLSPSYSCGLSTSTIEYSCPSVCVCVCVSVYMITQKLIVNPLDTWREEIIGLCPCPRWGHPWRLNTFIT